MAEQLEHFLDRLDLTLHLKLDLCSHQDKFLVHFMVVQISPDAHKVAAGFFDFAFPDKLSGGIWHKRSKTGEQDDAPRNLNSQRQSPLCWAIRRITACEANPVRHHRPERDTATRYTSNETTMLGSRDFAQIDGDSCDHLGKVRKVLRMQLTQARVVGVNLHHQQRSQPKRVRPETFPYSELLFG